jgi:hypothetical protein
VPWLLQSGHTAATGHLKKLWALGAEVLSVFILSKNPVTTLEDIQKDIQVRRPSSFSSGPYRLAT